MPYRINPKLDEQNHYRSHSTEQYYIERLRERGLLIEIDNVAVDAEQLLLRPFQCDTRWCVRCAANGASPKFKGSCCTDLQVDVTPDEERRIKELAEIASERMALNGSRPLSAVVRRVLHGEITEFTDTGERILKSLASGRCPLSWLEGDATLRCAINTLCRALDLDLSHYKPEPCFLFPLHYVEHRPGGYFLTLIAGDTYRAIGADAYVTRLRCLRTPIPGSPPAYIALRSEIALCLGEDFYEQLCAKAKPMLARHGRQAPEDSGDRTDPTRSRR